MTEAICKAISWCLSIDTSRPFESHSRSQQENCFPRAVASFLARYKDGKMVCGYQVKTQN